MSHRLAVQNCDWSRVKAVDLLALFQSFLPSSGIIKSVTVYPSEYGAQRIEQEIIKGPAILWDEELKEKDKLKDTSDSFHPEKLRAYELSKLKYYFAVIDCDNEKTASVLYDQCDGMELESSSTIMDLRFIPDDTIFARDPREIAKEIPSNYKFENFITKALQFSKVAVTWDEDDPDRANITHKSYTEEDEIEEDFKAYLASSSEDDDEDIDEEEKKNKIRNKYSALLEGLNATQEEKEDMEIKFIPGLSEKATELLEKKNKKRLKKNESAWETYLRKKKELKKERKNKRKEDRLSKKQENGEDNVDEKDDTEESEKAEEINDDDLLQDDTLPEDIDVELEKPKHKPRVKKSKKFEKKKKKIQEPKMMN